MRRESQIKELEMKDLVTYSHKRDFPDRRQIIVTDVTEKHLETNEDNLFVEHRV